MIIFSVDESGKSIVKLEGNSGKIISIIISIKIIIIHPNLPILGHCHTISYQTNSRTPWIGSRLMSS